MGLDGYKLTGKAREDFLKKSQKTRQLKDSGEELEKDKTLDDIFGIEIVCATEDEISLLKEVLEKFLSKTRPTKKHNKENGYKADHDSYYLKSKITEENYQMIEPDKTPIIECL